MLRLQVVRRRLLRSIEPGALGDSLFHWLTGIVAVGVVALLGLIAVVLLIAAQQSIRTFGFSFLAGTRWDSVADIYGAAPFVYGTLVTAAFALLLGVPISLGVAIFLSELAPAKLRVPLTYVVELLAAVPSVVYGFWGLKVLAPAMASSIEPAVQSLLGFLPLFQGTPTGSDKFSASVILAVMIVPTISAVSREALRAVPQSQREAALALGATRWESTRVAVVRYARAGIFGAIILGLGRAVGAAALEGPGDDRRGVRLRRDRADPSGEHPDRGGDPGHPGDHPEPLPLRHGIRGNRERDPGDPDSHRVVLRDRPPDRNPHGDLSFRIRKGSSGRWGAILRRCPDAGAVDRRRNLRVLSLSHPGVGGADEHPLRLHDDHRRDRAHDDHDPVRRPHLGGIAPARPRLDEGSGTRLGDSSIPLHPAGRPSLRSERARHGRPPGGRAGGGRDGPPPHDRVRELLRLLRPRPADRVPAPHDLHVRARRVPREAPGGLGGVPRPRPDHARHQHRVPSDRPLPVRVRVRQPWPRRSISNDSPP